MGADGAFEILEFRSTLFYLDHGVDEDDGDDVV